MTARLETLRAGDAVTKNICEGTFWRKYVPKLGKSPEIRDYEYMNCYSTAPGNENLVGRYRATVVSFCRKYLNDGETSTRRQSVGKAAQLFACYFRIFGKYFEGR